MFKKIMPVFVELDSTVTYFKITNKKECHCKFQCKDGLNELIALKNPLDGFSFTDIENIFKFIEYGIYVRKVYVSKGSLVIRDGSGWKSNKLFFAERYDLCEVVTIEMLINLGANIFDQSNRAIIWASENNHLSILKLLLKLSTDSGVDIRAQYNEAFIGAAGRGHLEIVKLLFENAAIYIKN